MASGWMEPDACRNLMILVESVTAPLLIRHPSPVCLEMDIESDLPIPCDKGRTADLIAALAQQALAAMPDGGDLMITGCRTSSGIELEIADSGNDVKHRERHLPIAAAAIQADLEWKNCPQGGVAVTILFPPAEDSRKRLAA